LTESSSDAGVARRDAAVSPVVCPPGYTCTPVGVKETLISLLSYRVVDAKESAWLDSLVIASDSPTNRVHIFSEATHADRSIALDHAPVAVAVDPAGKHAAVASNGYVSRVDLVAGKVMKTCALGSDAADLTLTDAGFAYVVPLTDQWVPLHVLDLVSCIQKLSDPRVEAGSHIRAHSSGKAVFVSQYAVPDNIERCDVTGLVPVCTDAQPQDDQGAFETGQKLWISADGRRIYSQGGTTLRVPAAVNAGPATYGGTIPGVANANWRLPVILDLSEATAVHELALIPGDVAHDSVVRVHATDYLDLVQEVALPPFPNGSETTIAHGRFVFVTPTLDRLTTIVQADAASSPDPAFAVVTMTSPLLASSDGSDDDLDAGSTTDASLDAAPLQPEDAATADAATSSTAPVEVLPYNFVDAAWSAPLGSIVMVSDSPTNTLHIFTAATGVDRAVALPSVPLAVAVDASGSHAAVAYDAHVSRIDLTTGVILKTCELTSVPYTLALTDAGLAYVVARSSQWNAMHELDLVSCSEANAGFVEARSHLALHPSGNALFYNQNGRPDSIGRCDLTGSSPACADSVDSATWGQYYYGENLWVSADGSRIYTETGLTLAVPPNVNAGYCANSGALSGVTSILHMSEAAAAQRIALIPGYPSVGSPVRLYDTAGLAFVRQLALPRFPLPGSYGVSAYGRFVFTTPTLDKLYVILQADPSSGTRNNFGITTLVP
jgi:hypothetical protein